MLDLFEKFLNCDLLRLCNDTQTLGTLFNNQKLSNLNDGTLAFKSKSKNLQSYKISTSW